MAEFVIGSPLRKLAREHGFLRQLLWRLDYLPVWTLVKMARLLPRDNSARSLMRAIKAGRSAGMVIDRRMDEGKPIRFFGRDKLSTMMPARLAMKFDCALVPVQVERRQDAHYRAAFHPPIKPDPACLEEEERTLDMMRQVHQHFEDWIRAQPEDGFCPKRIWSKTTNMEQTEEAGSEANTDSYAA